MNKFKSLIFYILCIIVFLALMLISGKIISFLFLYTLVGINFLFPEINILHLLFACVGSFFMYEILRKK